MEKNLIDIIAKSGIVGAGGAGFPTHVKMNAKAEYVIINGAECEPLLRVDQQLMAVETKKILDATCGSRTIWFNKNHPAAIYCDARDEEYTGIWKNTNRAYILPIPPSITLPVQPYRMLRRTKYCNWLRPLVYILSKTIFLLILKSNLRHGLRH